MAIDLAANGESFTRIAVAVQSTRFIVTRFLRGCGIFPVTREELCDSPFEDNLSVCEERWRRLMNGDKYQ
jgi:hypothetical protein